RTTRSPAIATQKAHRNCLRSVLLVERSQLQKIGRHFSSSANLMLFESHLWNGAAQMAFPMWLSRLPYANNRKMRAPTYRYFPNRTLHYYTAPATGKTLIFR